jgi:hypothetical protein
MVWDPQEGSLRDDILLFLICLMISYFTWILYATESFLNHGCYGISGFHLGLFWDLQKQ